MNLKCLLLPASRYRIAGKRNISKYLPVDIRMFVCIETFVCMYYMEQARVNHFNCSAFPPFACAMQLQSQWPQ